MEITKQITDEEFMELGYTRAAAEFMYGIDVECDIVRLRMSKLGLSSDSFVDTLIYYSEHDPLYFAGLLKNFTELEKWFPNY